MLNGSNFCAYIVDKMQVWSTKTCKTPLGDLSARMAALQFPLLSSLCDTCAESQDKFTLSY